MYYISISVYHNKDARPQYTVVCYVLFMLLATLIVVYPRTIYLHVFIVWWMLQNILRYHYFKQYLFYAVSTNPDNVSIMSDGCLVCGADIHSSCGGLCVGASVRRHCLTEDAKNTVPQTEPDRHNPRSTSAHLLTNTYSMYLTVKTVRLEGAQI